MTEKDLYKEDILKLVQVHRDRNNKWINEFKNYPSTIRDCQSFNNQLDDLELDIKEIK